MNIFVTVGTHLQGFERLIREIDLLKANKKINANIFAQIGHTKYTPIKIKFKKFLNEKEYIENFKKSDIIISHAGAGTIINAFQMNKKLIIVPRLKKFNEHTDNHQLELAEELQKKGKVISVFNEKKLLEAIQKIKNKKNIKNKKTSKIIETLNEWIKEIKLNK